jgi:hypothetical protein
MSSKEVKTVKKKKTGLKGAKHLTSQRQVDLTKENHLRIFIWEQTAVQLPGRGDSHHHISGIAIFSQG